ncbi:hypothetical protein G9C98_002324, partial [Cotesia typhae]
HVVQTGMAAPYGGGVFPPPVNGVTGVVGAAGAAGEVKPPPPVPVKEENTGSQQQATSGGPQIQTTQGTQHQTAPGAPAATSFSPPPPPNGVDQQAISEVFQAAVQAAAVQAAAVAAANSGGQQPAPTSGGTEASPEGGVESNSLVPVTSGATTPATATQGTDLKGQPKRLHLVSLNSTSSHRHQFSTYGPRFTRGRFMPEVRLACRIRRRNYQSRLSGVYTIRWTEEEGGKAQPAANGPLTVSG